MIGGSWSSPIVRVVAPFAHFDIPVIGQAYVLFRAEMEAPYTHAAGVETLETRMVPLGELEDYDIAFSSIRVALREYTADAAAGKYRVHHGVIAKKPGSHPADPDGFLFEDHIAT